MTLAAGYGAEALRGLMDFSQVEVLFVFDQVDPARVVTGARHPRNNPEWSKAGIFAQREEPGPLPCGACSRRVYRRGDGPLKGGVPGEQRDISARNGEESDPE
jgi:tRNA (Thr-GGU) A37 N-methylase